MHYLRMKFGPYAGKTIPFTSRTEAENNVSTGFAEWAEGPDAATEADSATITLPADFPFREPLVASELGTLAAVRGASDDQILGLPKIGPAALRAIRAAQGED